MPVFFQGIAIGLAYVAPIGLQNLFIIDNALTITRRQAVEMVLAAIFLDATLSLSCFFGIGAVMERWPALQMVVLLVGSLMVIWIGVGLLRAKAEELGRQQTGLPFWKMVSKLLAVTWCNPQALIDGTMLLGAFRVTLPPDQSGFFIAGVLLSSAMWFSGITLIAQLFSSRITPRVMRGISIVCGAVILFNGVRLLKTFFLLF
ncbi:LysE family transporter [Oscillibacter sp. MSJ-2]|uniref:LysE family transporter n=1 Tax=Dysosmobacter acutus TaxID=2841504 RepID=A0ABS6F6W8_9FIRM|nr:LysE family transporter [Dysosmobacter acutus]MBU5625798.1 LysE family transporter [Dysosmobacter acutus]